MQVGYKKSNLIFIYFLVCSFVHSFIYFRSERSISTKKKDKENEKTHITQTDKSTK